MSQVIALTSTDGCSTAAVSLFGARVLSWKASGRERIFMPASGADNDRAAPHGGIPVLFPQFGFFGSGQKHGVVRDLSWAVEAHDGHFALFGLKLEPSEHVPAAELKLRAEIESRSLAVNFSITNTSAESIRFTVGLHTYLRVSDITQVSLTGLENTNWQDALNGLQSQSPSGEPLTAPINVDRVYTASPSILTLIDQTDRIELHQSGFTDTVVWNPGPELASQLHDLADEEWRQFLCVEAAQIAPPVELPPWDTWYGCQRLQLAGD